MSYSTDIHKAHLLVCLLRSASRSRSIDLYHIVVLRPRDLTRLESHEMPHKFLPHSFFATATCEFCQASQWGIRKNFYQCDYCKKAACKKCATDKFANAICSAEPAPVAATSAGGAAGAAGGATKKPASTLALPEGVDPLEVHEFYRKYVKRNKEGEMITSGLPPEYKQLFREAGIKPSELRDPMTAIMLMSTLKKALAVMSSQPQAGSSGAAGAESGEHDEHATTAAADERLPVIARCVALYSYEAQSENDVSFWQGDIVDIVHKYEDGWYVGRPIGLGYCDTDPQGLRRSEVGTLPANYLLELPIEPATAPPPPPSDVAPASGPLIASLQQSMAEKEPHSYEPLAAESSAVEEHAVAHDATATATAAAEASGAAAATAKPHEAAHTPTTTTTGAATAAEAPQHAPTDHAHSATPEERPQPPVPTSVKNEPVSPAPAPPAAPLSLSSSNAGLGGGGGGPKPPPPPPPPQPKAFESTFKIPAKKPTNTPAPVAAAPSDLLEQIRKGITPRHVDVNAAKRDVKELNAGERTCLLDIMRGVMEERRKVIRDDVDASTGGADDEDWSD